MWKVSISRKVKAIVEKVTPIFSEITVSKSKEYLVASLLLCSLSNLGLYMALRQAIFSVMSSETHVAIDAIFCVANIIWAKVFKNGPSKFCGRQPSKNFAWSILQYFVPYVKHNLLYGKAVLNISRKILGNNLCSLTLIFFAFSSQLLVPNFV